MITWDKVKAWCWNSLTVAWAYALAAVGAIGQGIDVLGGLVGDPTITQQVQAALGGDPKTLGRYAIVAAIITLAARARGKLAGG